MMKYKKSFITEVLGVPSNIQNVAKSLFNFFEKKLQEEGDNIIDPTETQLYELSGRFKISNFNFNSIELNVGYYSDDRFDDVTIIEMGFGVTSLMNTQTLKLDSIKSKTIKLRILFGIPDSKEVTFSDVLELIQIEELEIESSFSHELKHAFDNFIDPHEDPKSRARYNALSKVNFGIPPLNMFVHYLYFASATENAVRPSEVHSIMKKGDIKKDMFVDFLMSNRVYKMYKNISTFSLESMKNEMINYIPRIDEILDVLQEGGIYQTESEKINRVLELFYINLSNEIINQYGNLLRTDILEKFFGFIGNKREAYDKFINEVQRFKNNPLGFFEYEAKKINYVANNMLKKLSKLYALIEEKKSKEKMDLQTKITNKGLTKK